MTRLTATYEINATSLDEAAQRAAAVALEQSIEMPPAAVQQPFILEDVLGKVLDVRLTGENRYTARVGLALSTVLSANGPQPMQFINMLFGNSSLHEWVRCVDVELPDALLRTFPGPRFGIAGIRAATGVARGAVTATALKPQGLPAADIAKIAYDIALGGIHVIKDDHGMANQAHAPFAKRVRAVSAAVHRANRETGLKVLYAPSLSGTPRELVEQVRCAQGEGADMLLAPPMLMGLPAFFELVAEEIRVPVLGHPSFGGAARLDPRLLFGKLFRLFGVDAPIYVNHGGRFAYPPAVCKGIGAAAVAPWQAGEHEIKPAMPVPAGGMTLARVEEMIGFYGEDVMLLIGGDLLLAKERMTEVAAAFVAKVAERSTGNF